MGYSLWGPKRVENDLVTKHCNKIGSLGWNWKELPRAIGGVLSVLTNPLFIPGSPAPGSSDTSPSIRLPPPGEAWARSQDSSPTYQLPGFLTSSMTLGKSLLLTGDPNKPTPCSPRTAGRIKEDEGCARPCYFRAGLCTCKACFYLLSLSEPSCAPRRRQGREGQQHRHKLAKPRPWTCLINLECLKIFFNY